VSSKLDEKLHQIAADGPQPELRGAAGTCRFDVEGGESRWIRVEDGAVTVLEAPVDADCTLSSSSDDWERMASGEQNPLTTWLRGDLRIAGDPQLANRVGRLFL
jgi:putative sterol carrier protein